jgi:hypothetical protein
VGQPLPFRAPVIPNLALFQAGWFACALDDVQMVIEKPA